MRQDGLGGVLDVFVDRFIFLHRSEEANPQESKLLLIDFIPQVIHNFFSFLEFKFGLKVENIEDSKDYHDSERSCDHLMIIIAKKIVENLNA